MVDQMESFLRDRGGEIEAYALFERVSIGYDVEDADLRRVERAVLQAELLQSLLDQHEKTQAGMVADADEQSKGPPVGSLEYYRRRKDKPLYEGCTCTVFQAAYCLMRLRHTDGWTADGTSIMMFFLRDGVLPPNNELPPYVSSFHPPAMLVLACRMCLSSLNADLCLVLIAVVAGIYSVSLCA